MRVLCTGGRRYTNWVQVHAVLDGVHRLYGITLIIQGCAAGADLSAYTWAQKNGVKHTGEEYRADWDKYGKSAGIKRNMRMLDEVGPHLVIGFPGGRGTDHMTGYAVENRVATLIIPDPVWEAEQAALVDFDDLEDSLDVTFVDDEGNPIVEEKPTKPFWLFAPTHKDKWSKIVAPSAPTPVDRYESVY